MRDEWKSREELIIDIEELRRKLAEEVASKDSAREELLRQREWFRVTLTSIGDAVLATDKAGLITFLNPAAANLTGWKPEEALGQPIQEVFKIINEKTGEPGENIVEAVVRHGVTIELANHTALISRNGRLIAIEDSAAPIRSSSGEIEGVVLVFHDVTERRAARREMARLNLELERRLAELQTIFDTVPIGLCITEDPKGLHIRGNRMSEELAGVPHGGELSRNSPSPAPFRMFQDDRELALRDLPMQQAVRGEIVNGKIVDVLRRDGSRVTLYSNARPLMDISGNPRGAVGAFLDFTELKRAEEEMRRQRKWLRITVSSIGDAVIATDISGRITLLNPVAAELTGWLEKEALGRHVREVFRIINEKTRQEAEDIVGRVLREGKVVALANHTALIDRAGREFPIEDSAAPIKDQADKVIGVVLVFHDVTERRLAENALRESEEHFRLSFDQCPIGSALTGFDRRLMRVNESLCQLLGYTEEELLSLRLEDITHPDDLGSNMELQNKLERGEIDQCQVEKRYIRKDGAVVWASTSIRIVRDGEGRPIYCMASVQDVTECRNITEELRKTRHELELRVSKRTAELEKANGMLRLLPSKLIAAQEEERKRLAGELHDSVGQTLAALKFRIEHIHHHLKINDPGKARQSIESLVPDLQRSIEETRAIYMGLRPKMLEELGIIATLKWYRENLLKLNPNRHIELDITVSEEEVPQDLIIAIFRIAQEALNNIAKHSRAEWVDFSLKKEGGVLELSVCDDGVGMDLGYILKSMTARSLGLAGMKDRAQLTGGKFSIKSAPNEGTTIKVTWKLPKRAKAERGNLQALS